MVAITRGGALGIDQQEIGPRAGGDHAAVGVDERGRVVEIHARALLELALEGIAVQVDETWQEHEPGRAEGRRSGWHRAADERAPVITTVRARIVPL